MIIKRLRMENVRSYKKAEVEFPSGKTLFEGDIGSGKSTILMAVEFALFGLGSARASSLLRNKESKGSVELEFESNGKEYSVKRVLARKGGSVQQVEGTLRGPDGEEDYPPTEMKERILQILNFRESPEPRSRSLVYQYAIYSRQEEMKSILNLDPNSRLSILRRAFGIEEYKTAAENAEELLRAIQAKRSQFDVVSRELPRLKREKDELEAKVAQGNRDLARLARQEEDAREKVAGLEKRKEALHELETRLARALSDRQHLEQVIQRRGEELEGVASEVESLEKKIRSLAERGGQAGRPPTEKSVDGLRAEVAAARRDLAKHEASDVEMGIKIGQYESVAEKGRCPVCDREADPSEFAGLVSDLSARKRKNSDHIKKLTGELDELEALLEKRRAYDSAAAKVKDDSALAEDYRKESERKRESMQSIREEWGLDERKLSDLDSRIAVLRDETKELERLRREIEEARREHVETKESIAGKRSDIRNWEAHVRKSAESIGRAEESAAKAGSLAEREIWLGEFFIATLKAIERHVMVSINREFASNFQRWFGILVEENEKEARVDEEFTPLVEQEGYDQDVEFLSGGERTSVALAYRLALSQMVQKYAEAGPSSLILDEPTDGFSKEQLGKVREILDELANPQVVIVSHERELESMADQIFRVAKVNGESRITR